MKTILQIIFFALLPSMTLAQTDTVYVYGPGGPFPAMNEAAQLFTQQRQTPVKVVKGPVANWKAATEKNADIIFSGSEFMMTNFINTFQDIAPETVTPLYLRRSGILVRPGNPKNIHTLADLLKPDVNILVVNGAGLTGIWEDMVGKTHSIDTLKLFRRNIQCYAANSGVAKKEWIQNLNIDAWITWNIWQVANANIADFVALPERYTLYRDCGAALTRKGIEHKKAVTFFEFLQSDVAKPIFRKWGWIVE